MSLRWLRDWTRWVWSSLCSLWPSYKCIGGWAFKYQQYFWFSFNETWVCWWYSSEYRHRCIRNYQRFQKYTIRLSKHWEIRYMNDRRSSERSRTKSQRWYETWTNAPNGGTLRFRNFSVARSTRNHLNQFTCSMMKWMLKLKQMMFTLMAMTATLLPFKWFKSAQFNTANIPSTDPNSYLNNHLGERSLVADSIIDNAPEEITAATADDQEWRLTLSRFALISKHHK